MRYQVSDEIISLKMKGSSEILGQCFALFSILISLKLEAAKM
jgi:hypothetical protein